MCAGRLYQRAEGIAEGFQRRREVIGLFWESANAVKAGAVAVRSKKLISMQHGNLLEHNRMYIFFCVGLPYATLVCSARMLQNRLANCAGLPQTPQCEYTRIE